MFFRDVYNRFLDEVQNRDGFSNRFVVLVSGVTGLWVEKPVIQIRLQHQEIRVSEYSGGKFFRKVQAVISLAVCFFFCCHKIKGRVYV